MAGGNSLAAKRTVREKLEYWLADADLASVRDKDSLDRLPEDERRAWRQLWEEVGRLLREVGVGQ
jgi:hypothetical protein